MAANLIYRLLCSIPVASAVFEGCDYANRSEMVDLLLNGSQDVTQRRRVLVCALLTEEWRSRLRNEISLFFRGNGVGPLLWDAFSKRFICPSLRQTLSPLLETIIQWPSLPDELAATDEPCLNSSKLIEAVDASFELLGDILTEHRSRLWCTDLRLALHDFCSYLERDGNETSDSLGLRLANVMVLRVISPTIAGFAVGEVGSAVPPAQRARIVLFTKILQKMANGQLFEDGSPNNASMASTASPSPMTSSSVASLALNSSPLFLSSFNSVIEKHQSRLMAQLRMIARQPDSPNALSSIELEEAQRAVASPNGSLADNLTITSPLLPSSEELILRIVHRDLISIIHCAITAMPHFPLHEHQFCHLTRYWRDSASSNRCSDGTSDKDVAFSQLIGEGRELLTAFETPASAVEVTVRPRSTAERFLDTIEIASKDLLLVHGESLLELQAHLGTQPKPPRKRPNNSVESNPQQDDSNGSTSDDDGSPASVDEPTPAREFQKHDGLDRYNDRAVVAHIAARLELILSERIRQNSENNLTIVFLSSINHSSASRNAWGSTWFAHLFEDVLPDSYNRCVSSLIVYKPSILAKASRRMSFSKRPKNALDSRTHYCDNLEALKKQLLTVSVWSPTGPNALTLPDIHSKWIISSKPAEMDQLFWIERSVGATLEMFRYCNDELRTEMRSLAPSVFRTQKNTGSSTPEKPTSQVSTSTSAPSGPLLSSHLSAKDAHRVMDDAKMLHQMWSVEAPILVSMTHLPHSISSFLAFVPLLLKDLYALQPKGNLCDSGSALFRFLLRQSCHEFPGPTKSSESSDIERAGIIAATDALIQGRSIELSLFPHAELPEPDVVWIAPLRQLIRATLDCVEGLPTAVTIVQGWLLPDAETLRADEVCMKMIHDSHEDESAEALQFGADVCLINLAKALIESNSKTKEHEGESLFVTTGFVPRGRR